MQVLVFGLGIAGFAAARLLQAQGHMVGVQDELLTAVLQERAVLLNSLGISVQLGQPFCLPSGTPSSIEQIVVSPGIAWDHPVLQEARHHGISTIGEAELAWQRLCHRPWVGITGTNGKSTTTALISSIFQSAGLAAPACGNIGLPLCEVALKALQSGQDPDWVIAELSSYQLEASPTLASASLSSLSESDRSRSVIGIWTTFTPDHLERHGTLDSYAALKARLVERSSQAILNGDDAYLWDHRQQWPQAFWVRVQGEAELGQGSGLGAWIDQDQVWIADKERVFPWLSVGNFPAKLPGEHNLQNLLMAVAAAYLAGLDPLAVAAGIESFPGMPHRLETVRTVQGIRCINDSKATNYEAALVGLKAVDPPVVLIAGGKPKLGQDADWLAWIRDNVSAVLLIGEAAPKFAARLQQVDYTSYEIAETLDVAVPLAFERAKTLQIHHPTVTLLLSPACASFDQYPNFERRGEHFRQCCQQLDS